MAIHIRRREFIITLGSMTVAWTGAARAQYPIVGVVSSRSLPDSAMSVAAFRRGLADSGYVDGRNLEIIFRWAEGHYDRLPALAADLARRQVAVILATGGNPPALAAKAASATIPVVFIIGSDPVEVGLVASLNHPGGNITGVSLPTATTLAFLVNPSNSNAEPDTKVAHTAARELARQLMVLYAATEDDIDAAFATLARDRVGTLVVNTDAFFSRAPTR